MGKFIQRDLFAMINEKSVKKGEPVRFLHNTDEEGRIRNSNEMAEYYKPVIREVIDEACSGGEIPLFGNIMLSTCNKCNGSCSFCAASNRYNRFSKILMSDELVSKIISELEEIDYKGRITMQGLNEPLLDDRMCTIIEEIHTRIRNARIHIITNGTLLNCEKLSRIYPCVKKIHIDNYSEEIRPELQKCLDFVKQEEDGGRKLVFSMRRQQEILAQFGENECGRTKTPGIDCGCILPYNTIAVQANGKVSLCMADIAQNYIVGDLEKNTLTEIWYGEKMAGYRRMLRTGRKNLPLCRACDMFCF